MQIFILAVSDYEYHSIIGIFSSLEKAEEEKSRRDEENLSITSYELDPPFTVIKKGFVKGPIYEGSIDLYSGEISHRAFVDYKFRNPDDSFICNACDNEIEASSPISKEYLKEILFQERYSYLLDNPNYIEEERERRLLAKRARAEIANDNPSVNDIEIGDVLESKVNGKWCTMMTIRREEDKQYTYDLVMKSPGSNYHITRNGAVLIKS